MYNQIRAEFYKLFHTKALYLTFALILAVFGIFSIGGQQQFVVSSSSVDETWKIGETVGFLARAYSDQVHPMIEEIIRTATSYTVFFWLIVLIFSVVFFSREYTDSTIKIAIASGQSRLKFFIAKYIVITVTSIILYFSFIMVAFITRMCEIQCADTTASNAENCRAKLHGYGSLYRNYTHAVCDIQAYGNRGRSYVIVYI